MNIKLLPKDFDWNNYLLLNTDLTFTKEEDCKNHYFNHGINEDRIYILGKAEDLKVRLSTYDKSCDHIVEYYKECYDEFDMKVIEEMGILKLNKYREVSKP